MKLRRHRTCCALPLDGCRNGEGELAEAFVMLVGMGFYEEADNGHYQMAIPEPTLKTVKAAIAKYAATEDEHRRLHPEWLVAALPKEKAQARVAQLVGSRNARE